jgi:hypothetical protein
MAVLRPLKVVIENYPEGKTEELEAVNHPDDPAAGSRRIIEGSSGAPGRYGCELEREPAPPGLRVAGHPDAHRFGDEIDSARIHGAQPTQ